MECVICKGTRWFGPIVIAEVKVTETPGGSTTELSYAHAQCWIDSGREIIWPPDTTEPPQNHVRDAVRANS